MTEEVEITHQELHKMLTDGKITHFKYAQIMIDHMGREKFMEAVEETLKKTYGNLKL